MPSEERATRGAVEPRDTALRAAVFVLASLAVWWCWSGEARGDEVAPTSVDGDASEPSVAAGLDDPAGPVVPDAIAGDPGSAVGPTAPVAAPVVGGGEPVEVAAAPDRPATPSTPAHSAPGLPPDEPSRSLSRLERSVAEALSGLLMSLASATTPLVDDGAVAEGVAEGAVAPVLEPALGPVLGGAAPGAQQVLAAPDPALLPEVSAVGTVGSLPDRGVGTVGRSVSGSLFPETSPPTVSGASPSRGAEPARSPRTADGPSGSHRGDVATYSVMNATERPLTPAMAAPGAARSPVNLPLPTPSDVALPESLPAPGASTSVMVRTADVGSQAHRAMGATAASTRSAQPWVAALSNSAVVVPRVLDGHRPPVTPD